MGSSLIVRRGFPTTFIIVIVVVLVLPVETIWRPPPSGIKADPAALFIFGDSLFDSGNNNYINTTTLDQANFWPYGLSYFNNSSPTGRFSDGRLISDFIGEYARLRVIPPPYLQPGIDDEADEFYDVGMNFASAGAGSLVQTFQGSVISLQAQVKYYKKVEAGLRKKLGQNEAKMRLSRAVYLFSIGTNDYISLFITNSTILNSLSHSQYVDMVISNLTTIITEIYGGGGRKFGLLNLGPLGCLPGMRIIEPAQMVSRGKNKNNSGRIRDSNNWCFNEEASLLAKLHNQQLSIALSRMEKHFPDFKYTLYDFHTNLKRRITHPYLYGLREGKAACCGSGWLRGRFSCGGKRGVKEYELCDYPNEYVFWDSYHLTQVVYQQLAIHMWNGTTHSSSNFNSLFQSI